MQPQLQIVAFRRRGEGALTEFITSYYPRTRAFSASFTESEATPYHEDFARLIVDRMASSYADVRRMPARLPSFSSRYPLTRELVDQMWNEEEDIVRRLTTDAIFAPASMYRQVMDWADFEEQVVNNIVCLFADVRE